MRREWIEMDTDQQENGCRASPSMRREWIEMIVPRLTTQTTGSPSMRREWIEMMFLLEFSPEIQVSLHAEGVD